MEKDFKKVQQLISIFSISTNFCLWNLECVDYQLICCLCKFLKTKPTGILLSCAWKCIICFAKKDVNMLSF